MLATACDQAAAPGNDSWVGSVDTLESGRVVIRNKESTTVAFVLEERLRLGALDADGPELFGQIAGLALGEDGEVFVLDGQAAEVRVFSEDGTHLRSFGGEGEGPGELSNPSGLAVDSSGTVWVMNWGNARYSGFDPATGAVVREPRRVLGFAAFPWRGAFEYSGRLVDIGLDATGEQAVLRLDDQFEPRDTLALPKPIAEDRVTLRRGAIRVASLMDPFAPQSAWAPRVRAGIVVGEGSAYRLHRIDFGSDTSVTIELDRAPIRVTTAERDSALSFFQDMSASLDGVTPDRPPNPGDVKPLHGAIFVDDHDRTWVRGVHAVGATRRLGRVRRGRALPRVGARAGWSNLHRPGRAR